MTCVTCLHVCSLIEFLNKQFTSCRNNIFFHVGFDSLAQEFSISVAIAAYQFPFGLIRMKLIFVSADGKI